MNSLFEHLTEVCKRNRVTPEASSMLAVLKDMDDNAIMAIINGKKTVAMTLKYGLLDVIEESLPPGLKIQVKDYDVQPEEGASILEDDMGQYYLHEFERIEP